VNILIAGDSWACGEWSAIDVSPIIYRMISHKGLEQYLLDAGHTVTNIGVPGAGFAKTFEGLFTHTRSYDAIFVFVTDAFRDIKQEEKFWNKEYSPQYYKELFQKNLRGFVNHLNSIPKSRGPIYLLGSLSKVSDALVENTKINVAIPSILELIIPDRTQYEVLFKDHQQTITKHNSKPETINYVHAQHTIWESYELEPLMNPDGRHPNRDAHKQIYQNLKENKYIS